MRELKIDCKSRAVVSCASKPSAENRNPKLFSRLTDQNPTSPGFFAHERATRRNIRRSCMCQRKCAPNEKPPSQGSYGPARLLKITHVYTPAPFTSRKSRSFGLSTSNSHQKNHKNLASKRRILRLAAYVRHLRGEDLTLRTSPAIIPLRWSPTSVGLGCGAYNRSTKRVQSPVAIFATPTATSFRRVIERRKRVLCRVMFTLASADRKRPSRANITTENGSLEFFARPIDRRESDATICLPTRTSPGDNQAAGDVISRLVATD